MPLRVPSSRAVWVAGGAVLAAGAAAVIGITLWAQGPAPADAAAGHGPSATGTATSGAPLAGADASPGATGPSGAPGATPTAGAAAAPTPSSASELHEGSPQTIAPQPAPTPLPTGPSLTGPLPPTASVNGDTLVAGFPQKVVPLLSGVRPVASSVASEGDRMQVGLEASSDQDTATVLARYTATFQGAGFVAGTSPAVPGSTAARFTRGPDGLVVTVRARTGGGTELTISGALTTAG